MAQVYILGAGASCFAGYPLGLELWRFIRDRPPIDVTARERAATVADFVRRVLEVVRQPEPDLPDLEQIFTLLDLAEAGTDTLGLGRLGWRSLRPMVMGTIADVFQSHQHQLRDQLRDVSCKAAKVLDAWVSRVHEGDTIITFNWDLLNEAALWHREKWHYADGYGFTSRGAPSGCCSRVKVLKLHGSVNWAQSDEQDCEPAIQYRRDFFPRAPANDLDDYWRTAEELNDGRNLIVPSYLKDLSSNRLLLKLWNQASDALSTAEQVTVVGFRLHPADALARQLLGCAMERNPNSFPIRIVSPQGGADDHWDEFCRRIGRDCHRVRLKFEEWVLQGHSRSAR